MPRRKLEEVNVFIASPGDLDRERRVFKTVIDEVNQIKAHELGFHLVAQGWQDARPAVGRPQEIINPLIEECDLFIMLLWKRWGSETGEYSSGTEEEFNLALSLHKTKGHPETQVYFKGIAQEQLADVGPQLRKVLKFRRSLEQERILMYSIFKPNEWEKTLRANLCDWISRLSHEEIAGYKGRRIEELERKLARIETEYSSIKRVLSNAYGDRSPSNYFVSCKPTTVIQVGVAELLGEIKIEGCEGNVIDIADQGPSVVSVCYRDVHIVNICDVALSEDVVDPGLSSIHGPLGMLVSLTGGYAGVGLIAKAFNTDHGGTIEFTLPPKFIPRQGGSIRVEGVRARVTGKPVGSEILASVQAQPVGRHSFLPKTIPVATTNQGMILVAEGVRVSCNDCPTEVVAKITISEGFPAAFAQYVPSGGMSPSNARKLAGANTNTSIELSILGLPFGTVVKWPSFVQSQSGPGRLVLIQQLGGIGNKAVYEFATPDQYASDLEIEVFEIVPSVTLSKDTQPGCSVIWGSLQPREASVELMPRFLEFLQPDPPDLFLEVEM